MAVCTNCNLINPPDARVCDCGFSFETGDVHQPDVPPSHSLSLWQRVPIWQKVVAWLLLVGVIRALFHACQ